MIIVSHDYYVSYLNTMIIIDDKYHDYDDYIYDIRLWYYYILTSWLQYDILQRLLYMMLIYIIMLMCKGI